MRQNLLHNPKNFFKFANSKNRAQKFPFSVELGNKESLDNLKIAYLFADIFRSSHTQGTFIGRCEIQLNSNPLHYLN